MRRDELHPSLAKLYQKNSRLGGVASVDHPRCKGMWFVVPHPAPRVIPKKLPMTLISEATAVIESQPRLSHATPLDKLLSYLFLRKEAVESSRIEGTMSTIDHVLTPGDFYEDFKAKTEGASVRGYAYVLEQELEKAVHKGVGIFNLDLCLRLHREFMMHDPKFKGIPGRFRSLETEAVCIGSSTLKPEDSIFNPTPPQYVKQTLAELMTWYSDVDFVLKGDAGLGVPLIVRMAIGHAHFEAIHPFLDGNGRVGRMLNALQMACLGKIPIYLSGFIEEHKNEYYSVLQDAQKKLNYVPIVEFFSRAIISSSIEEMKTRSEIEKLSNQWSVWGGFRKNSTAERMLTWMISHPIFTVKNIEEKLQVSAPAANAAITQLLKEKIIRERTGFERNRIFAAEEVIALLSRPFDSSPEKAIQSARKLMGKI